MAPWQTWPLIAALLPLKMKNIKKKNYAGMTGAKFVKATREFSNSFAYEYKQGSPEPELCYFTRIFFCFSFILKVKTCRKIQVHLYS